MVIFKAGWEFIQDKMLGMQWFDRLIGNLLNTVGLNVADRIGGSVQFFIYDTIKIMVLLEENISAPICPMLFRRLVGIEPAGIHIVKAIFLLEICKVAAKAFSCITKPCRSGKPRTCADYN